MVYTIGLEANSEPIGCLFLPPLALFCLSTSTGNALSQPQLTGIEETPARRRVRLQS